MPLMAKVDLDLVKFILQRNDIEVRKVNSIMEDIEQEMKIIVIINIKVFFKYIIIYSMIYY